MHNVIDLSKKKWITVQIPLSHYSNQGVDLKIIGSIKIEENGNIKFNNIYFSKQN
jgi:hypothetical protein